MQHTTQEQIEIILNYLKKEANKNLDDLYGPNLVKYARQIDSLQHIKRLIPHLQAELNPKFKSGFDVTYVKANVFHDIAKYLYRMNGYKYGYTEFTDINASFYFYGDYMGIQVSPMPENYISLGVYCIPKELQELEL